MLSDRCGSAGGAPAEPLGREQVETTQVYVPADLAIKERALARTVPVNGKPDRYRPPDSLLAFQRRSDATLASETARLECGSRRPVGTGGQKFLGKGLTVFAGGLLERSERIDIEEAAHQLGGGPGPGSRGVA